VAARSFAPALVALAAVTVASPVPSASAAPSTAESEVQRLQGLVDQANAALAQATVEAEATTETMRLADEAVAMATRVADQASADAVAARLSTEQARVGVSDAGRQAYMGSSDFDQVAMLLDAADPEQFIDRAGTLTLLAEERNEDLLRLEEQQALQDAAEQEASRAVADAEAARTAAADAQVQAADRLGAAQADYDQAQAQWSALQGQLRSAQIAVLAEQGVADPAGTFDSAAADAQRSGTGLVEGRVTSCYGPRSGTNHNGIDIAAPIGTPIYAPAGGVVIDAGPANGFGLAVYIQHPDGTITLYGHINDYFVSAGQTVEAGQVIAEVGNRGQSTGPHLHIETHTGGLYANRADPAPWLAQRGITLGGRCG
jgi:murein DD-endopeptidase MepM/ murein hydrolase activator NlpD